VAVKVVFYPVPVYLKIPVCRGVFLLAPADQQRENADNGQEIAKDKAGKAEEKIPEEKKGNRLH
jgi:hypothetical protein